MLMSIFSSFDVLCAESFGQKVSVSNGQILQKPAAKVDDSKSSKEVDRSPKVVKKKPEVARRPRFAPEFDGVHCFETILPY
ncbi:hypothetical protein F511_05192 [Dorcoceras hygrometricum]|uniref:Uncharacterized protein n=1 Tax=Dorcoceras hygrometricum TaxID=472368 RepID=A0A2Z7C2K1_9LAMI|nr:hypothetical protein F511_05192 [Dorcoceras hygrometricum]